MSKTKIEPMRGDTIKTSLHVMRSGDLCRKDCDKDFKSLILAWIHAEARARYSYHNWNFYREMTYEDWIAAVKKDVGWGED